MEYVLLLVGFVLLVKGADFFVEGSSSLAKILKVPRDVYKRQYQNIPVFPENILFLSCMPSRDDPDKIVIDCRTFYNR